MSFSSFLSKCFFISGLTNSKTSANSLIASFLSSKVDLCLLNFIIDEFILFEIFSLSLVGISASNKFESPLSERISISPFSEISKPFL